MGIFVLHAMVIHNSLDRFPRISFVVLGISWHSHCKLITIRINMNSHSYLLHFMFSHLNFHTFPNANIKIFDVSNVTSVGGGAQQMTSVTPSSSFPRIDESLVSGNLLDELT